MTRREIGQSYLIMALVIIVGVEVTWSVHHVERGKREICIRELFQQWIGVEFHLHSLGFVGGD